MFVSPKKWKLLGWMGAVGTQHVAAGDVLPEEIYCQRRYVTGGDMLPKGIHKGGI